MTAALLIPAACALATSGPAFLAACRATSHRPFAPLVRGSLERSCVLLAAGLAAASITAQIGWVAAALAFGDDNFAALAWRGFVLFGPPCIAAAAFCAGEVLSGPSVHREPAFAAAAIAAYAAGVGAFAVASQFSPGASLGCAASAAALGSAAAYLAARGDPTPAR
jgi:hypothetical protein